MKTKAISTNSKKEDLEVIKGPEVLAQDEELLLHQIESNPRLMEVVRSRYHSGPLPSPDDISEYDRIIPDGADRIMRMAEKEQEGRTVFVTLVVRFLKQLSSVLTSASHAL